ncbi:MAG TPA: YlxR family protein [Dermatophilaceae bacterium]|nr:YlxR family protein [Dermatophilaceae bacterium]
MGDTDRSGLQQRSAQMSPRVPTRTCVGCRGTDSWSALLRVVAVRDEQGRLLLTPDPRRRLPGRGAWLHPEGDCFALAVRRRAFGRALHVSAPLDLAPVTAYLEAHTHTVRTKTESGFDADEHPMRPQR